jgi:PIN domain nuclease of toxin-antitoxin system
LKNNPSIKAVLLDTSFLLPTLGIEIGKPTLDIMARLQTSGSELCYSDLSLLECLWVATQRIRHSDFDESIFRKGILSITKSGRYRQVQCSGEAYTNALKLYQLGHKDMIDNMLYATALNGELQLLTLDDELKTFIEDNNLQDVFFPTRLP